MEKSELTKKLYQIQMEMGIIAHCRTKADRIKKAREVQTQVNLLILTLNAE